MDDRKEFGSRSEELAASHLASLGYEIIEKNYRAKVGEIDIIAKDGGTLVFVEVKSLRSAGFGVPELKVDHRKRRQIARAAMVYLTRSRRTSWPCRFDVVAITRPPGEGPTVDVIRDAFELDGGY